MYSVDNRAAEIWTALPQQVDAVGERFLLIDVETPPPVRELSVTSMSHTSRL